LLSLARHLQIHFAVANNYPSGCFPRPARTPMTHIPLTHFHEPVACATGFWSFLGESDRIPTYGWI